jgi:hypothetical protein
MTAFRATYADIKLIKTRQCVQIVFELPIEQFDAAYEVLGGMPLPGKERWFGIAAIKTETEVMPAEETRRPAARPEPKQDKPARAKRDWRDVPPAQQAGTRCHDPEFAAFLREHRPEDWRETAGYISDGEVTTASDRVAECVRLICCVASRKELNTDHRARMIWHQLDEQFLTQQALERAS